RKWIHMTPEAFLGVVGERLARRVAVRIVRIGLCRLAGCCRGRLGRLVSSWRLCDQCSSHRPSEHQSGKSQTLRKILHGFASPQIRTECLKLNFLARVQASGVALTRAMSVPNS